MQLLLYNLTIKKKKLFPKSKAKHMLNCIDYI